MPSRSWLFLRATRLLLRWLRPCMRQGCSNTSKQLGELWHYSRLLLRSLCFNVLTNSDVVIDSIFEPVYWIVDHLTSWFGVVFVSLVIILTSSVLIIVYSCMLPIVISTYSAPSVLWHLCFGHWNLVMIVFHYYKAIVTSPGHPPQVKSNTPSVSICKKCIIPKPARTHHCSICNSCVLKMDHHCHALFIPLLAVLPVSVGIWLRTLMVPLEQLGAKYPGIAHFLLIFILLPAIFIALPAFLPASIMVWFWTRIYLMAWLNNCVGHFNHRYFFCFCLYMTMGCIYCSLTSREMFLDAYSAIESYYQTPLPPFTFQEKVFHKSIIYLWVLTSSVAVALGGLTLWHAILITRGETSIERHINNKETQRLKKAGKVFRNPHNFGKFKNWKVLFGVEKRSHWLTRVLLPSCHGPFGDGLTWDWSPQRRDLMAI